MNMIAHCLAGFFGRAVGRSLRSARMAGAIALAAACHSPPAGAVGICNGRFPNPIADICWSCLMPITLGGGTLADLGGQGDIRTRPIPCVPAA